MDVWTVEQERMFGQARHDAGLRERFWNANAYGGMYERLLGIRFLARHL